MLDRELFNRGFALLCERYGKKPSEALRQVYYDGLADLSAGAYERGVRAAIHRLAFWPTVDQLRPQDDEAAADRAWSAIVRRLGAVTEFSDTEGFSLEAAINASKATAPAGGWGMLPLAEEHWYRGRFLEAYRTYQAAARSQEREALPGFSPEGRRLVRDAIVGKLNP